MRITKNIIMIVLSTGCLYKYGLNRTFEIAKELGFDGVEIFTNSVYDTTDKSYLEKLVTTFDIPIVALKINNNVKTANDVKQIVTLAENLSVPYVVIRVPFLTDFRFVSWFKRYLPRLQDKTSVKIAIENPPAGKTFLIGDYALSDFGALKRYQHLCLDTSHLVSRNADLMRTYEAIRKHLDIIHISNWYKGNEHWILTEGILPLESFLTKLGKDSFQGPICLKLKLENLGDSNLKQVIKNLKKSKDFYEEYYLKNLVEKHSVNEKGELIEDDEVQVEAQAS